MIGADGQEVDTEGQRRAGGGGVQRVWERMTRPGWVTFCTCYLKRQRSAFKSMLGSGGRCSGAGRTRMPGQEEAALMLTPPVLSKSPLSLQDLEEDK